MNMTPDMMNGLFEGGGALFILNHCRVLFNDKSVKGVSILSTVYFFLWWLWNLFYYPHLEQMWSFTGGIAIMLANCLWIYLLYLYRKN